MTVRVTDPSQPPTCRLALLKEPRKDRQGNVRTICNLSIDLSEEVSREVCLAIFGFLARVTREQHAKGRVLLSRDFSRFSQMEILFEG